MQTNSTNMSHINRRKAGRFSPNSSQGYTLQVGSKTLPMEKVTDIGAEGFKIVHRAFQDFAPEKNYEVVFKKFGKILFKTKAKVTWSRQLRHPMNTNLLGFTFIDEDFKVAQFWVQKGYSAKDFEVREKNNYAPLLRFHKILTSAFGVNQSESLKSIIIANLPEVCVPMILAMLFISAVL